MLTYYHKKLILTQVQKVLEKAMPCAYFERVPDVENSIRVYKYHPNLSHFVNSIMVTMFLQVKDIGARLTDYLIQSKIHTLWPVDTMTLLVIGDARYVKINQ